MNRDGTVRAHHACCDALLCVTEDVASQQIDPSEGEDENARSNYNPPKRHAKRLLTSSRLIEVAHDLDANHDHGDCKGHEAT